MEVAVRIMSARKVQLHGIVQVVRRPAAMEPGVHITEPGFLPSQSPWDITEKHRVLSCYFWHLVAFISLYLCSRFLDSDLFKTKDWRFCLCVTPKTCLINLCRIKEWMKIILKVSLSKWEVLEWNGLYVPCILTDSTSRGLSVARWAYINLFTNLFIQQIFIESLLCTRHCIEA